MIRTIKDLGHVGHKARKKNHQLVRATLLAQIASVAVWRLLSLMAFLMLGQQEVRGQLLYPEDFVERLASAAEIREHTGIKTRLQNKVSAAEPLFELSEEPFSEILPAIDRTLGAKTRRPKQWVIPPFPDIEPALPDDSLERLNPQGESGGAASLPSASDVATAPLGFSEIELVQPKIYSARLRPKVVPASQEFVFRVKELVPPFSLRRYFSQDRDAFVQIAAFGGTTSWGAEEAYRAMKQVTVKQDKLEGIGAEAFLTRVQVIDPESLPPEKNDFDGPAMPGIPPFADIEPKDRARPDLINSASAVALMAPSFRELPVKDLEGKKIRFPSQPKKYYQKGGEIKQSLWVLVAFFPDQALTFSFALEERLGNVQDLVDLALFVQKKLSAYKR